MTDKQWEDIVNLVRNGNANKPLTGFIIDSPWIPGWFGISHLQFYSSEKLWFEANRKAIETFPDTIFLPGFWSEFGMCTEPSAFGAKCIWKKNNLPHADIIIRDASEIKNLKKPNPRTDGLLPFMTQRLSNYQQEINDMGHRIKFAVCRGPLNIASFLMGTTEFMMDIMLKPEEIHNLLNLITDFSVDWIQYQKELFPEIEGILILDDIVGFLGEPEVKSTAIPYLKKAFEAIDAPVKFFHNDANGLISTPFLKDAGINMFNFSFEHDMNLIRELAGPDIVLVGNLPPRDVLARGSMSDVEKATLEMYENTTDKSRILWSCGGGMPMDVPAENIRAFLNVFG